MKFTEVVQLFVTWSLIFAFSLAAVIGFLYLRGRVGAGSELP